MSAHEFFSRDDDKNKITKCKYFECFPKTCMNFFKGYYSFLVCKKTTETGRKNGS